MRDGSISWTGLFNYSLSLSTFLLSKLKKIKHLHKKPKTNNLTRQDRRFFFSQKIGLKHNKNSHQGTLDDAHVMESVHCGTQQQHFVKISFQSQPQFLSNRYQKTAESKKCDLFFIIRLVTHVSIMSLKNLGIVGFALWCVKLNQMIPLSFESGKIENFLREKVH